MGIQLIFNEADDGTSFTSGGTPETPNTTTETDTTVEDIIGKGTFFEGLEKDYYEDPSLKAFMDDKGNLDAKNIIKSYIHTKRQFGKDKITVPGEHATEQEWREVLTKLGLPTAEADYGVAPKDEKFFQEDFVNNFKKTAFETGILPKQAQQMLDWYQSQVEATENAYVEKAKNEVTEQVEALKKEWGNAYESKLNLARTAYDNFADEAMTEALEKQGLNQNPTLLRLFAKIGEELTKEGTIKGDSSTGDGVYTPSDVEDKIKEYMAEPAYWDGTHPQHSTITQKVNKLYAQLG